MKLPRLLEAEALILLLRVGGSAGAGLQSRAESLAMMKRDIDIAGVCMAGYYACPAEFGGCCMNGRMCATKDCPPEAQMHGQMINLKDISDNDNSYVFPFDVNSPPPRPESASDKRIMNVWAILGLVLFGIFFLIFACVFGVLCLRGQTRMSRYRGSRSVVPATVVPPTRSKRPTFVSMALGRTKSAGRSFTSMFKKKQHRPVLTEEDFAEPKDTYANLNKHEKSGLQDDDELLAPSPPPTPAPAYGWSNQSAPSGVTQYAPPPGAPPPRSSIESTHGDTSYKSQSTTSLLRSQSVSLAGRSSSEVKSKRTSLAWDHTQTRPDFDPFDEDPRGKYDPDSRSGL